MPLSLQLESVARDLPSPPIPSRVRFEPDLDFGAKNDVIMMMSSCWCRREALAIPDFRGGDSEVWG